ncbi:MAG: serine--tRNA ligase [Elusimicrobiales bacterium]|jgi:seryl-tRNA synthetase|nr:serine--tRNA ligase [Elusimicrobiales bacterium]
MLDIKFVRDNLELVEKNAKTRNLDLDFRTFSETYDAMGVLQRKIEDLRAMRKAKSVSKPTPEEIEKVKQVRAEIKTMEVELAELEAKLNDFALKIPNLNHESTPIGKGETGNLVLRHVGDKPVFSFSPKEHFEVGAVASMLDLERGAKVSGSRFYYLKDKLAILERAMIQFALDRTLQRGFKPILPPLLVKQDAMFATGFFPADKNEIYAVNPDEDKLFLIGTSEVPLVYMHSDETILEADLPLKYVSVTPCFRRESGSYGKDTRGIFRVHQFYKVEMVVFCRPEDSWSIHEELLAHEESVLKDLGLHFQVVNICSGELGASAAKKYDCEVWFPGQGRYREVTSTSNTTDYQSRRANIKCVNSKGEKRLLHTLNGTVSSDRPLLAIIETFQDEKGNIKLPACLVKYTGFEEIKNEG